MGYGIKLAAFPSPEATVQRYFKALQARDLSSAAEELASGFGVKNDLKNGATWSVMWLMLSDQQYQPPSGVRMGGWQEAPTAEGDRLVAVQYELAGTTYSSLMKLRKQDGQWRIANGTGTVQVNVPNALVNGQKADKSAKLFPGVYQVGSNPFAPLLIARPVPVVVTPDRVGTVRLSPTLATDALAKVKQHLDMMVKACETTTGVSKNDCPYKGIDTSGMSQVSWKLVSLPELMIEQSGPDSVAVKGVGPGSVHLNAVGADGKGVDRVDSFSINGKCVEKDSWVSCTFTA